MQIDLRKINFPQNFAVLRESYPSKKIRLEMEISEDKVRSILLLKFATPQKLEEIEVRFQDLIILPEAQPEKFENSSLEALLQEKYIKENNNSNAYYLEPISGYRKKNLLYYKQAWAIFAGKIFFDYDKEFDCKKMLIFSFYFQNKKLTFKELVSGNSCNMGINSETYYKKYPAKNFEFCS